MSLVKLSRSLAVLAFGASMLAAQPVLAEALVVRASGPSAGTFAPGKKLPDGATVTLKQGDVLTLLDGRGTRTLRGPGVFGASAGTGGGSPSIASFIGTRNNSRARTGAVRGTPAATQRSPNLWYVDISQATTVCVPDPANVKLWRPASAEAGTLIISGKGGARGEVAFEPGQALANWPAELPVAEGASYQLSGAGLGKPVALRLTVLDADGGGLESTASTLIARKCDAQLDLLIDTVALPDTVTGG